MASSTFLITGAGRGLGRGFVANLLKRPNTTVVAAVRDPSSTSAKSLSELPVANDSKLIVVKINSDSVTDPFTAVSSLLTDYNIPAIDVVIANAAIVKPPAPTATASVEDFQESFQVNAMAPLLLFQATWPLLQKSQAPKFIGISTCLATIGKMEEWKWPTVTYGVSKAAMNYIVRKMHFENEDLVAFAVHPGWVQTDSGNSAAKAMGKDEAPDTVESSVEWILEKIEFSTKENISGTFQFFGRGEYSW